MRSAVVAGPRGRAARRPTGPWHHLTESIVIDAGVEEVFARWTRYEELPRVMESVRRTKQIGARCVLWDVDIGGRQVVFEARIVESVPEKHIRWKTVWGAPSRGEVSFEALTPARMRVRVELELRPRGLLERLGVRLGLVETQVRRDLSLFRNAVERDAAADRQAADRS